MVKPITYQMFDDWTSNIEERINEKVGTKQRTAETMASNAGGYKAVSKQDNKDKAALLQRRYGMD